MGNWTDGWFKIGDAITVVTVCVMIGVPLFAVAVGVCIGAAIWA